MRNEDLYRLCCAGEAPAEVLPPKDRERLVAALWECGWTDVEIADHTHMSTYTTVRIRERLELPIHRPMEGVA